MKGRYTGLLALRPEQTGKFPQNTISKSSSKDFLQFEMAFARPNLDFSPQLHQIFI